MRRNIFLLFLLKISITASAQITFQKTYGGSGIEYAHCIRQTFDGGYVIVGETESYGAGSYDIYLIKLNSTGDTIWTKTIGDANEQHGYSLEQTSDSGYIITGSTSVSASNQNLLLIKTDVNGSLIWSKSMGGIYDDIGYSVKQTFSGQYIITGVKDQVINSQFSGDIFLVLADANGDTVWTRQYARPVLDVGVDVEQIYDGSFVITGTIDKYDTSFNYGFASVFLMKVDTNGNTLWGKSYSGPNYDFSRSLQATRDSGFIILANTQNFGASLNDYDLFVIKTDALGDTLWTKVYRSPHIDHPGSVLETFDGGYLISSSRHTGAGFFEVCLIKTDNLGDTLWTKAYDGSGFILLNSQQTNDSGYIIVISGGIGNMQDMYCIKTDAVGNSGCYQTTDPTYIFHSNPQVGISATPGAPSHSSISTISLSESLGGTISVFCSSVGMPEIILDDSFVLYPNPSSLFFTITHSEGCEIILYNLIGEVMFVSQLKSNSETISIENLSPGIYFVQLKTKNGISVQKLIKQ